MSGRGRERLVRCEKCGRQVRRDKAVFIEKMMFSNPLDRNQVQDEQYKTAIFREVCYCPSCGKHGRIYEKKTQQNEREREREKAQQERGYRPGGFGPRAGGFQGGMTTRSQQESQPRRQQPKPVESEKQDEQPQA